MIKRLPIIPTILVAAAVGLMIWLGIWQLQRARWKEGLLARYAQAETLPPIAFPGRPLRDAQLPLFRMLGTPAADKRQVVFETPHDVRLRHDDLVREVLGWYDKYLGRVQ